MKKNDDFKLISVISPVFNEETLIIEFIQRVRQFLKNLSWELILVDDGSTDASFELICKEASLDQRIEPVKLSRNFGHQPAISCGFKILSKQILKTFFENFSSPIFVVFGDLIQFQSK